MAEEISRLAGLEGPKDFKKVQADQLTVSSN